MTRYFDLSQRIENRMSFYPGDPRPVIRPAQAAAAPWRVSELNIGTHTGTHMDAASHYLEQGMTIDQYPIERLMLNGISIFIGGLNPDEPIGSERLVEFMALVPKGVRLS